MAVSGGVNGGYRPPEIRGLSVAMSKSGGRKRVTLVRPTPPILISTNPTHVNPHDLRHLCSVSNHSCHRFPNLSSDGQVEPVDVQKLRTAISHSSVVLSVFAKAEVISYYSSSSSSSSSSDFPKSPSPEFSKLMGIGGDWFQRVIPVTPFNGQLVGFGRAVSDCGLTASIYDVMYPAKTGIENLIGLPQEVDITRFKVTINKSNNLRDKISAFQVTPPLRGMGIGRTIVQRIIRGLTSRGIYDIAALCSDTERSFFEACGFGDDIMNSTTMMYTRTGSSSSSTGDQIKSAGRKLLLVPPLRGPFQS